MYTTKMWQENFREITKLNLEGYLARFFHLVLMFPELKFGFAILESQLSYN